MSAGKNWLLFSLEQNNGNNFYCTVGERFNFSFLDLKIEGSFMEQKLKGSKWKKSLPCFCDEGMSICPSLFGCSDQQSAGILLFVLSSYLQ